MANPFFVFIFPLKFNFDLAHSRCQAPRGYILTRNRETEVSLSALWEFTIVRETGHMSGPH